MCSRWRRIRSSFSCPVTTCSHTSNRKVLRHVNGYKLFQQSLFKFCHNCGKHALKIHQIRQSVPNTNRSFHFSFFFFWEGVGCLHRKAISTPHDSDRSYVMADFLRWSQSKVAEENKQNNANNCHSQPGWCDDMSQRKTKHDLIWTIGFSKGIQKRPFACHNSIPSDTRSPNKSMPVKCSFFFRWDKN